MCPVDTLTVEAPGACTIFVMDVVDQVSALAPRAVPCLQTVLSIFSFITENAQKMQASKEQLNVLVFSIAQLLYTLNNEYVAQRLLPTNTSRALEDLQRFSKHSCQSCIKPHFPPHSLLNEISAFIRQEAGRTFLKLLYTKDNRITLIDAFHRRLATAINGFQVLTPIINRNQPADLFMGNRYPRC